MLDMEDPQETTQMQTTGDGAPQNAPVRQADFTPRSMQELQQFAKTVSQSRMVPKKYRGNPQDITVAVMHGMELGLPPLQALQSVAVINGRPSIYGDAALALVRKSGLCEYVKEWQAQENGEPVAYCKALRKGDPEPTQQRFSWSEAQEAGLTGGKGPWNDYPRRMLQMRARSWCLRDAFPDVLSGLMLAEEAEAIPESNGPSLDPQGEMDRKEPWWYRKIRSRITEKVRAGTVSAGEIDRQTVPESHPIAEWPDSEVEKLDSALTDARRQTEGEEDDSSGKANGAASGPKSKSGKSHPGEKKNRQSGGAAKESGTDGGSDRKYSGLGDAISQLMPAAREAGMGDVVPEDRRISSEKEHEDDTTQLGRLMYIADQNGWKSSWLDRLIKDELGFESKKHIPWGDPYEQICDGLEDQELKFWASRDPNTKEMEFPEDDEPNDEDETFGPDDDLPF